MYYLVNMDHNSMAVHLIRSRILEKCCICNAVDETDNDRLWNDSEENGDIRSECTMKALTVKMKTVTLSSNGR